MGKPCVAGCEALSIDAGTEHGHDWVAHAPRGRHDHDRRRHRARDRGQRPLVPPAIDENFETILGWADELRRLKVRANADTPEDAAKAREFGRRDRPLPHGAHVHGRGPAARRARDDPRAPKKTPAALDRHALQQADFEGIFEAMRACCDDLAARPASARVPAGAGRSDDERDASAYRPASARRTRCSGPAAAGWACSTRRSTRCRCVRSCGPPAQWRNGPGRRRSSRSCTRSSGSARSCADCAS